MKKFLILILLLVIVIIGGIFIFKNQIFKPQNGQEQIIMTQNLNNKKIAIIIAFRDFRDEEYFIPKNTLESAGADIQTISTETDTAVGSQGGEAKVDVLLSDLKVADFDAIVFIGGPGTLNYLDNETSYQIAKEAVLQNKVLAAICISPTILAKAEVLAGKKATVWSSALDKSAVKILKDNGAIYQDNSVVVDGNVITANGPGAAEEFGKKIIEALSLRPKLDQDLTGK